MRFFPFRRANDTNDRSQLSGGLFEAPSGPLLSIDLKKELANLCTAIAHDFSLVAHADPQIPQAEKDRVNRLLGTEEFNAAMMPDEVCQGSADLLCGHLHAMGHFWFHSNFVSPAILAPHARTVVENAASICFLCHQDPGLRVLRSMRQLRDKLEEDKTLDDPILAGLHQYLEETIQREAPLYKGMRIKDGGYTKLVSRELCKHDGGALYSHLSKYAHQNSLTAYLHLQRVRLNSLGLEIDSMELTLSTLRCVLLSYEELMAFRSEAIISTPLASVTEYESMIKNLESLTAD